MEALEIHPMIGWGQHEILCFGDCNVDKLKCRDTILQFNAELVPAIGMVAYGDPILEHFANHDPIKGGYTLIQLIETSNIACHFAENIGQMFLDVFSCLGFEQKTVIDLVRKHFDAKKWMKKTVNRGDWSGDVYHEVEAVVGSMASVA